LTATEGQKLNREFSVWSENDQKLIEERDEVLKTITAELSEYKYHLASEKLYQYVWSRFADVILEESKIVFNGRMANTEKGLEEISAGTPEDQNSRAQFLLDTLQKIVTVLHPFMPHVTEELWSILSTGKGVSERDMQGVKAVDLLMAHPWPVK
jgi:valyl-tRNA synthetase